MKQKLTPWFPIQFAPVRQGWYEYTGFGLPSYGFRRYWDGKGWSQDVKEKLQWGDTLRSDKWRGLLK